MTTRSAKILSFLLIGCGSVGLRHALNLAQIGGFRLLTFDLRPERAQRAASECGGIAVDSVEQGLAEEPDAVLVCTPPHLHGQTALQVIATGSHLFIEKPIAHNLEILDELITEAAAQKRVVMVGYNLRFHAGLLLLKRQISAGLIGRPLFIRAEVGQFLPEWRPNEDYRTNYIARRETGGGIILDASHELDYVRWLLGEPLAVYCAAGHLSSLEIETEDTAAIIQRLSSGAFAEIHLDCIQHGYSRNCKIVGENGTLFWDFGEGVSHLKRGELEPTQLWSKETSVEDMYQMEMKHFVSCIRGEAEPPVNAMEGKRVVEIALAALRSAQEHREIEL